MSTTLKKERKRLGFEMTHVSKQSGVPLSSLSKYESGTRKPNVENFALLCEFYNKKTISDGKRLFDL